MNVIGSVRKMMRAYATASLRMSGGVPMSCMMPRSKMRPTMPITTPKTTANERVVPAERLKRGWSWAPYACPIRTVLALAMPKKNEIRKKSTGKIDDAAANEMMALSRQMEITLIELYRPDGVNLGMNVGKAAGAGIAGHIHMHVLPRWVADANFITVIGETRILPELLETTYQRLKAKF